MSARLSERQVEGEVALHLAGSREEDEAEEVNEAESGSIVS